MHSPSGQVTRAQKFLRSNLGVKTEDMIETNKMIMTKDGRRFVPKQVIGITNKAAVFYKDELRKLFGNRDDLDRTTYLLVPMDRSSEITPMPARLLAEGPASHGGVKLVYQSGAPETENGIVLLHLKRRNADSHILQISYVPAESLLVWREGEYRLSVSSANGRPDFFLALKPAVMAE